MKRLRALLPLLALLSLGVALLAGGLGHRLAPARLAAEHALWLDLVAANPLLSRLAYVALLTLVTATGIPASILVILAGGLIYGEVQGVLLSSVGLTLGSLILFLAGRYAFHAEHQSEPALVDRLRHGFAVHPVHYTLFLRFVPVFPFGGVSVALAWLGCPLWLFLLATWLGGTLMLVFETAVGADLGRHLHAGQPFNWSMLIDAQMIVALSALALLSLLPLGYRRWQARKHGSPRT